MAKILTVSFKSHHSTETLSIAAVLYFTMNLLIFKIYVIIICYYLKLR